MQCIICKKIIKKGFTIDDIFDQSFHHICRYCYAKHPVLSETIYLPIEDAVMTVESMGLDLDVIDPMAYMSFIAPYLIGFIKFRHHDLVMIFDNLNIEMYTMLDVLKLGRMYAITLCLSID